MTHNSNCSHLFIIHSLRVILLHQTILKLILKLFIFFKIILIFARLVTDELDLSITRPESFPCSSSALNKLCCNRVRSSCKIRSVLYLGENNNVRVMAETQCISA